MRSAPPVLVPVGRFVWAQRLALIGAVATAALLALAWRASAASSTLAGCAMMLWLAACLLAWRWHQRDWLAPGSLAWDGEGWHFQPHDGHPMAVQVRVLWDLGSCMLLGVQAPQGGWQGSRCAWLHAADMPERWHGWRCAVYGRDIL